MEREPLSIRKFAEVCGVSHTEIGRKMTTLGIAGTPQGKGLPTLLSPAEQDQIAQILFIPAEPPAAPAQHVEVLGSGLSVYTPAPLATRGTNSELSRHIQHSSSPRCWERLRATRPVLGMPWAVAGVSCLA